MELSSEYRLKANVESVWWVLTNPTVLKSEIPGLTKFEEESPDNYLGEVKIGVGFIKFTYSGTLTLSELDPPEQYRVRVVGGGRGGSLDGSGVVTLRSVSDAETLVSVEGYAKVGGMIGKAGDRAIGGAASKVLSQFFEKVEAHAKKRSHSGQS